MPSAVNNYLPTLSGKSATSANQRGQLGAENSKAFAATLDKFLTRAESDKKKADAASHAGPLQALTQLLPLGGTGTTNGLGGLRADNEQLQARFQASFRRLLEEQGIDLGAGVSLQTDAGGEIRVSNDHPDKLFIESALKNDPELTNLFRKISANSNLLHAAEMAKQFQQAYGIDPQQALAQYEQLFGKQTQQTFSLTITSNGAQESFTSPPANAADPIL
jgi:hypothetical protein